MERDRGRERGIKRQREGRIRGIKGQNRRRECWSEGGREIVMQGEVLKIMQGLG